jgi:hypothetical protein
VADALTITFRSNIFSKAQNSKFNMLQTCEWITYRHILHMNLTFRESCIMIYSYNKIQQDALFLKFILIKNSTRFGQTYCPSSAVLTHGGRVMQICVFNTVKLGTSASSP